MTGAIQGLTPTYSFNLINFDFLRWHTYEQQNWTKLDSILYAGLGGLSIKGYWMPNTAYAVNDSVVDNTVNPQQVYGCVVAHTSGTGTFAQDRTANPTFWVPRTNINPGTVLQAANNLSDVPNKAIGRTNLGVDPATVTKTLLGTGNVQLGNGLIMQWGVANVTGTDLGITFPKPFPSACFSVVATPIGNPGGNSTVTAMVDTVTASNFALRPRSWTGSSWTGATVSVCWIAFGT